MITFVYSSKVSGSLRYLCFVFKERAELVHKVHLLCLLSRGRIVDNACNDPLIQVDKLYPLLQRCSCFEVIFFLLLTYVAAGAKFT